MVLYLIIISVPRLSSPKSTGIPNMEAATLVSMCGFTSLQQQPD